MGIMSEIQIEIDNSLALSYLLHTIEDNRKQLEDLKKES